MTLEEFMETAGAVPFKEFGRSFEGWDCWGLVHVAYKQVLGIELPLYTNDYESARRRQDLQELIVMKKVADWEKIEHPQPMDACLLHMYGRACHIGLMIDEHHFMHVEERAMVSVSSLRERCWVGPDYNKVEGVYRHASRR